jgi:hypothetical protein
MGSFQGARVINQISGRQSVDSSAMLTISSKLPIQEQRASSRNESTDSMPLQIQKNDLKVTNSFLSDF